MSPAADATPVATSCFDDPPTTAPDPLTVSGTVVTLFGSNPLDNAVVEARSRADDSVAAQHTTMGDGGFSLDIASGGTPWNGYFSVARGGMFTSYVYFSGAVADNYAGQDIPLIDQGDIVLMEALVGVDIDTGLGSVVLQIVGCEGDPVPGATVSFSPAADNVIYMDGSTPDLTATATDDSGGALAFGVPVGSNTVTVSFGDIQIDTQIDVEAQSLIGLFVQP